MSNLDNELAKLVKLFRYLIIGFFVLSIVGIAIGGLVDLLHHRLGLF